MDRQHKQPKRLILTVSLTTGVARVARGMPASVGLIDEILTLDHSDWETILFVGDIEFHRTRKGPFPNHQMRISVNPSAGFAALNYADHDDARMPIANSYNSTDHPPPEVDLIFNGGILSLFPRAAAIPIPNARQALIEWLKTRRRPNCIEWRPYDAY